MSSRPKSHQRRRLQVESLEDRRCLAASVGWDGAGRGSASLTYHLGNVPASTGLTTAQVESAIETALDAWANVANLKFTPTSRAGQARSIDITFAPIDGPGGTLAQAYFPADVNSSVIAGDVQFDSAELWEIGNAKGYSAEDIVLVAVHELGHALGLDHISGVPAVMNDSVSPNQSFTGLKQADVDAILKLYAPAPTTSSSSSNGTTGANTSTSTSSSPTNTTTTTTTSIVPKSTNTTNTNTTTTTTTTGTNDYIPRRTSYWFNTFYNYFWGFSRFGLRGNMSGAASRSAASDTTTSTSTTSTTGSGKSFTAAWQQALADAGTHTCPNANNAASS